ncbi:Ser/Thr protein phosphatase [Histomonas meleagridis]|uniref:Ser/Thr protein phosphatase n=1 Tax=Histomonas meleagridis TaxID=135588 RepID=UPI00355A523E|nr:Ser/Thr protein phosphatase [Histomonas meleagridis]KAH0800504.1 Ser/Thr protein phosphatase [Histomonas meleagridis]
MLLRNEVSISDLWSINEDQLTNTITSQQYIEGGFQFSFILKIADTLRKNISIQIDLCSFTNDRVGIVSTFVIEHPKGPLFSKVVYLSGFCTKKKKSIFVKTDLSLTELIKDGFISPDTHNLNIHINLKSVKQVLPNIGHFSTIPNMREITAALLSDHKISSTCTLSINDINWICAASSNIMLKQPTLLDLDVPLVIVGDIVGQYCDLIRIFKQFGFPGIGNYLFLGNYSGSGSDGVDTLLLLLAFKILYPNNIFLLRGDHESEGETHVKSFYEECARKKVPYTSFTSVFNSMPIAAVIGKKIFCVHAGISPTLQSIDDVHMWGRPAPIPPCGIIHDFLFSNENANVPYYSLDLRDNTLVFGPKALQDFIDSFGYELVVKGNQCVNEGFSFPFGKQLLISLYSASGIFGGNSGAVMIVGQEMEYSFFTYKPLTNEETQNFFHTDYTAEIL